MKVDPRVIEPFNVWWRAQANHCEAQPETVRAFAAGFKAGLERAVLETTAILRGEPRTPVGKDGGR